LVNGIKKLNYYSSARNNLLRICLFPFPKAS
jgi:hypothetical protein